jgi:hypothetical protein
MLMAVTTVLAALVALQWGYNPILVAVVNGFLLIVELVFVAANATKLLAGGWFPLMMACVVAFLMVTWRTGYQMLEQQRSRMRQREDEFTDWVLESRPIRLPGAAAIFTAATSGIPLALTHHLRHNRVLHERMLLVSTTTTDAPRVDPEERVKLIPVGHGITRVLLHFGFMEHPNVMEGLKLACRTRTCAASTPRKSPSIRAGSWSLPTARCPGWLSGGSGSSRRCTSTPICRPPISASRLDRSSRSASKSRSELRGVIDTGSFGGLRRTGHVPQRRKWLLRNPRQGAGAP